MKLREWWKGSPLDGYGTLSQASERLFEFLDRASPVSACHRSRTEMWRGIEGRSERLQIQVTQRRARAVERHIVAYVLFGLLLVVLIFRQWPATGPVSQWIVLTFSLWRITDILQATVNMSLFHHVRSPDTEPQLASVGRTVVLTLVNYLELLLLFGLLYAIVPSLRVNAGALDPSDFFYFSVISQTSIGYGDIAPMGMAKVVAIFQGVVGVFFTLLILARVIALLPKPRAQVRGESKKEGTIDVAEEVVGPEGGNVS